MPEQSAAEATFASFMSDPQKMHRLFVHSRKEFAVENFCCFYLIEAFKITPRKRMAKFLIDNYMKLPDKSKKFESNDAFAPYAIGMNFTKEGGGSLDENNVQNSIDDKRAKIAAIGTTFSEKVAVHGRLQALKMKISGSPKLDSGLFDDLQKTATVGLGDVYNRFIACPHGQAESGGEKLSKFRNAITVAGWSPDALGMWD